jgi:hypothetical protein
MSPVLDPLKTVKSIPMALKSSFQSLEMWRIFLLAVLDNSVQLLLAIARGSWEKRALFIAAITKLEAYPCLNDDRFVLDAISQFLIKPQHTLPQIQAASCRRHTQPSVDYYMNGDNATSRTSSQVRPVKPTWDLHQLQARQRSNRRGQRPCRSYINRACIGGKYAGKLLDWAKGQHANAPDS